MNPNYFSHKKVMFSVIFGISAMLVIFSIQDSVFGEISVGMVNIILIETVGEGGTGTFELPSGLILSLTLPDGISGVIEAKITEDTNPTSDGNMLKILGEIIELTLIPSDVCSSICTMTWTFTDSHLAAEGLTDPADVIIFQDPEGDGTFIPLPTTLIDGAPSPYTVSAQITSTSLLVIGATESEPIDTFCGKTIDEFDSVKDGTGE